MSLRCCGARRLERLTHQSHTVRFLSSLPIKTSREAEEGHSQPFVKARFQAGEWDPKRTNPLYRPKWKSRAKIISSEDFAKRPSVGFSGEFQGFQDAMVTLSWLDDATQKHIYQLYLELQKHAYEQHKKTSHEYVMRVIAQKFNITAERVAATVQLQHNEEQIKKNDPERVLLTEAAEYMEKSFKKEIADAYKTFNLKKPDDEFVEDPAGVLGMQESKMYQAVDDLFDMDQITQNTVLREERDARLMIDGQIYVEDADDDAINIPLSKDAAELLRKSEKLMEKETGSPVAWPENEEGKRPRWKFMAQIVNTREEKSSYVNNKAENTLVEQDGKLRAGTMADVKMTSWKPVRNTQEHIYGGVKKGWLDRSIRGDESAWGKAPTLRKTVEEDLKARAKEKEIKNESTSEKEIKSESSSEKEIKNESSSDSSSSSSDDSDEEDKKDAEPEVEQNQEDGDDSKKEDSDDKKD
jgi:hypothetical protein